MPNKEESRQASLPLNGLDLELGTSDLQGKLQAAEASNAGTPPVEHADRLRQVKESFRSVVCVIVSCGGVHNNMPIRDPRIFTIQSDDHMPSRARLVRPLITVAVMARCDVRSAPTFADGKVLV